MVASFWGEFWMNSGIYSTIAQILFLILAGAGLFWLDSVKDYLVEWWKSRRLHPLARAIRANRDVGTLLVELRAKSEADRANVYLFHNGQIFSNLNPVWRISCTQETCRPGISHEINKLQSMLASTIWEGLSPMFGEELKGMKVVECNKKRKCYVFNTDEMDDSFFKLGLASRGIKTKVVSPLIDKKHQIVGFVSINFCTETHVGPVIAQYINDAAWNINYTLMS